MTGDTRIERALPQILEDLGAGPIPDYAHFILVRTASMSQRPDWVFPERWLPMSALTQRVAAAPRIPLRAVGLVALLILALAVAALYVGSQQRRLPAPYGPASNGLVSYSQLGDIYVGDPATGEGRPVVTGPDSDVNTGFNRDGTELGLWRSTFSAPSNPFASGHLMIAKADGSGLHPLNDAPLVDLSGGDWSGDGRSIVLVSSIGGRQTMTLFDDESGDSRVLDVGMPVEDGFVAFRPPDGEELLFLGRDAKGQGIFVVGADGSNIRAVVRSADGLLAPSWSPDGAHIAYSQGDSSNRVFIHVVSADGTGDVVLENPPGVIYQVAHGASNIWSPDGRSLLIGRGYCDCPPIVPPGTEPDEFRLAIISVDGSVPDRELSPSDFSFGSGWGWSPDGTKIVTQRSAADQSLMVVDIETGDETTLHGWFAGSWQRVAQ